MGRKKEKKSVYISYPAPDYSVNAPYNKNGGGGGGSSKTLFVLLAIDFRKIYETELKILK